MLPTIFMTAPAITPAPINMATNCTASALWVASATKNTRTTPPIMDDNETMIPQ